ncbi:NADP-specific glutamate dehydrogenase [Colwellia sp. D2M02]|uniref:NADP-specific glutamate dehydrogenase n=1 Tax=Colwellia sp. D2M02 TaxID=2841562 RepID=UPI001C082617|nr:NADP-specific glutamate dehydrogenase [Colwellia sp. D2M02]MBU2892304.1 NADP-specific glutamate dehydrogenase [Colwellia sp. D2M02]
MAKHLYGDYSTPEKFLESFMAGLEKRNPGELEFHQAVKEVAESVVPYMFNHKKYFDALILERMTEPDRTITFRVCWEDDLGNVHVNRGYRVQFNNAIGPYKGGLRFDPSVNLSILKFLGFEQQFKNSLTTLPMGAGKGGSDFNPKGKSDREIMRFCQAYMTELSKHIGENLDVPAGDIGVGAREISYMFGQYKRLNDNFVGVLTGKGISFGGSLIRTEATGYGVVYFTENMLNHIGDSVKGKRCVISGSGNVALYAAKKIIELGGQVLAMSDSGGYIYDESGIDNQKLEYLIELKTTRRGRIEEYCAEYDAKFVANKRPWAVPCDLAFPCATQNELSFDDATDLVNNGVMLVAEGANMPSTIEAVHHFKANNILFAPAKAANAGGVAISGLEMTQNSMRISWTSEEVDQKLQDIMRSIHAQCVKHGQNGKNIDYLKGANIAGFIKVADAMLAYGVI